MDARTTKVLVTGGTGFVGHYVTEALLQNGCNVRLITRSKGPTQFSDSKLESVAGDVLDPASLEAAARGCDAVVHLVGIIEEVPRKGITFESLHVTATRNIVEAAKTADIHTFVHMSANGAAEDGRTAYQRTKWQAEQIVKESGITHWTIYRPSLIFGKPVSGTTEFATRVRDTLIRPFPIWPVPGKGDYKLQPIAVQDVAAAFAYAASGSEEPNTVYCAGGPETLTYLEILDIIARASGEKVRPKLFQPIWGMRPIVSLLAPTGLLPITPAQLELLVGGNTCAQGAFDRTLEDTLGKTRTRFSEDSLSYLRD